MNNIYNPGDNLFKIFSNYSYYVDKTDLILELNNRINTFERYICVATPKGFGKSVTTDMLTAYYSYSEQKTTIFNDKKIANFKYNQEKKLKYLNEFNVLNLNMENYFLYGSFEKSIEKIKKRIITEFKDSSENFEQPINENISNILKIIYNKTNRAFVIIIDDYDYIFQKREDEKELQNKYLLFLKSLLEVQSYIALVYMTGLLPFKYYGMDSDFPLFNKLSMTSPDFMANYIGFNDNEVKKLCKKFKSNFIKNNTQYILNKKRKLNNNSSSKMSKEERLMIEKNFHETGITFEKLKSFYDGYLLKDKYSNNKHEVYSPYSILKAIIHGKIDNYQMPYRSELQSIIDNNFERLKDSINLLMNYKKLKINSLIYQNDVTSFIKRKHNLILLVHLGYLGYDEETEEIFIPNEEMHQIYKFLELKSNIRRIFNPNTDEYKTLINSKCYVDKTKLILELNKLVNSSENYICVTRPKHFGKTYTACMLASYYSYRESNITIFNDKKIAKSKTMDQNINEQNTKEQNTNGQNKKEQNENEQNENENWDKYLGKFNVIKLNMTEYFCSYNSVDCYSGIKEINRDIVSEIEETIPEFKFTDKNNIYNVFEDIEKNSGRKIVIIIDGWDCILRERKNDANLQLDYIKFLRRLMYNKSYIALVYMTGVLPIKKYGSYSLLNIFKESSMTSSDQFVEYVGFTDEDVKELCNKLNNGEKKYDELKHYYNGYKLINSQTNKVIEIYKPCSIEEALQRKKLDNYWKKMETTELLSYHINFKFNFLKDDIFMLMEGKKIKINIENYQNDIVTFNSKDDILTILIHMGYLGYDSKTKEVFMPNNEIESEYLDMMINGIQFILN